MPYPVLSCCSHSVSHPDTQYSQRPQAHPATERDPVTDRHVRDGVADLFDDADSFVTGYEWHGGFDRPFSSCGVDVGVAESAGLDLDEHLVWLDRGDGAVADGQRFAKGVDGCCFHSVSSRKMFSGDRSASGVVSECRFAGACLVVSRVVHEDEGDAYSRDSGQGSGCVWRGGRRRSLVVTWGDRRWVAEVA